MKPGLFRFWIEIQEPLVTQNAAGEPEKIWTFRANVRGDIADVKGQEKYSADQPKSSMDTIVTIHADIAPFLTTEMRLVSEGRVYDVEAMPEPDRRKKQRQIYCKRVAC